MYLYDYRDGEKIDMRIRETDMYKKKHSFVVRIVWTIVIMLLLLTMLLLFYVIYTFQSLKKTEIASVDSTLRIYGRQMDGRMDMLDKYLSDLLSRHATINQMSDEKEENRYYAAVELQTQMKYYLLNSNLIDYMVIMEKKYGKNVAISSDRINISDKEEMRKKLSSLSENGSKQTIEWSIEEFNGQNYIFKQYKTEEWTIALFSKLSVFLAEMYAAELPEGQRFLIADKNNRCRENLQKERYTYEEMILDGSDSYFDGQYMVSLDSDKGDLRLIGLISRKHIMKSIKTGNSLILLILLILIACIFVILNYIRKEIYLPMNRLIGTMKEIEEGDYQKRVEQDDRSLELWNLTNSFNHMMDVIVHLRIKSYDDKIRLLDTEIKYFQLQIKPHFFLNALTTIYSMSYQERTADIREYIDILTKTIRYMFCTGLHTVTLKEEVLHLKNYFSMQDIKYPNCVFRYFEIGEEAETWKIPQMLLHTFVENKYKYSVNLEKILTILVKADIVTRNGEQVLHIVIEDDGVPFPEEVLEYMNGSGNSYHNDGTRVGLWNIKRTMEVIYRKEQLLQLSNLETSGCRIDVIIPNKIYLQEGGA